MFCFSFLFFLAIESKTKNSIYCAFNFRIFDILICFTLDLSFQVCVNFVYLFTGSNESLKTAGE